MTLLSALNATSYVLAPEIVLTPDGPRRGLALQVRDGRIEQVCPTSDLVQVGAGQSAIPLPGRAIIPGFVDAHAHLSFTFGKAVAGGEPAQMWQRIWNPLERSLDPHRCYVAAKWYFVEALRGGYTTIVNFVVNDAERNEAIHTAAREAGIRLVSCSGVDERILQSGEETPAKVIDLALRRVIDHVDHCTREKMIYPSVCCGGYLTAFPEVIAAVGQYCSDHNVLFQLHSNEHFPEVHNHILKHGCRPIEFWGDLGVLGANTLLHHAVLTSEREIELLRETGTAVSYNPVASQWKGNGVAPALRYATSGIRMGLGSDTTRIDGFRTMDAAESCQRIAHGMPVIDFSSGAGWIWVDVATRGGADVSGLKAVTGALAPGLAADFLVLDMDRPEVIPSWDFEWELVRYYNRDQIEAVVVDGKPVMQVGKAVGWDQDKFIRDNAALARSTVENSGIVRLHGSSEIHRAAERERRRMQGSANPARK